jgi:hypothetical protein
MSKNPWVAHVKKVQAETGLSYKDAKLKKATNPKKVRV